VSGEMTPSPPPTHLSLLLVSDGCDRGGRTLLPSVLGNGATKPKGAKFLRVPLAPGESLATWSRGGERGQTEAKALSRGDRAE
jgi:hypothetical protein